MAINYHLQPNEVVLLKEEGIYSAGFLSSYNDDLFLTNMRLLLVKKGSFGKAKEVLTFPLDQIKIYNHQPQAKASKAPNGAKVLEVQFLNGMESFRFSGVSKQEVQDWVDKINYLITGVAPVVEPKAKRGQGWTIPGTAIVAGLAKGTADVFKSTFSSTSRDDLQSPPPARGPAKCHGCGAPLSGIQRQTITCEYCGTVRQL